MYGDTDRPGLIGQTTLYGLLDPPAGIGAKLIALGVIKLLNGSNEAEVAVLDKV